MKKMIVRIAAVAGSVASLLVAGGANFTRW